MSHFTITGRLLLGAELVPGAVVVEGESIAQVVRGTGEGLPGPRYRADIVTPGFIDLQVNGGFGAEVGSDADAVGMLSRRLPETGVTSYLPTLVTSPSPLYAAAFAAFRQARFSPGAQALGLHLEGPFLSPQRPGAHRPDLIAAARWPLLETLGEAELVRLVTLAPERPGALEWIARLSKQGILVSLGHTDATFEQFERGVDAGARMVTHLYNAMSPFHHRAPGAVGAALLDDRVAVGLIPDGIHSHAATVALAMRLKEGRVALVTDMMSAAGMPPGRYFLAGREVELADGAVRLPDGTLAGSALTMDQAIRNVATWGVPLPQALRAAAEIPAGLLGLCDRGALRPGARADLVLLSGTLNVTGTVIGGTWAWGKSG